MSQSNNFPSRQGTLDNGNPQAVSRNDHSDRKPPTAEVLSQHQDVAQSDTKVAEPTSIEHVATSGTSTPGLPCDDNRVQDLRKTSTSAGIKQNLYPCEPCEGRELKCDGVRPMCNNCGASGRRCVYEI